MRLSVAKFVSKSALFKSGVGFLISIFCYLPYASAEGLEDFRTELGREYLPVHSDMVVISSQMVFNEGDEIPPHFHDGIEVAYVIQGAMLTGVDGKVVRINTGENILKGRNVVHGGLKVQPNNKLVLFTVHIIDKDQPIYHYTNVLLNDMTAK